jgi:hypothetical protein
VQQQDVLQKLTDAFGGHFIIENTPSLTAALVNKDKLQDWVAARELFTIKLQVHSILNNEDIRSHRDIKQAITQSNQLQALEHFIVRPGDEVHLLVTDSLGDTVCEVRKAIGQSSTIASTPVLSLSTNSMFSSSANAAVSVDELTLDIAP